ncbi:MAG: hypothetical protein ACI945_001154, partial [Pseudohongiellaceae bacterium]
FDCPSQGGNHSLNIKATVAQIIDQFQCAALTCTTIYGDRLL